ncbi:MAG: lysine-2,3-aminomutase-like protein [Hyphomicrobiaceae bacterium]|nr:lysine-2,3-aminomutase-like protein [Hyphomicrobiaceae bacterium]MCC0009849.1 lysine-2,3-aminomutase-like protein [Hyphomicrobiaceae bacterium]
MTKPRPTLRTADHLVAAGLQPPELRDDINAVSKRYAVAITPAMAELIDPLNPIDPIARQFVPSAQELVTTTDELHDPIGDDARSPLPGIVHRYPDRVLLKLANVCPVYCRFCFRRETVGRGQTAWLDAQTLNAALAYIAAHRQIFEVIVTGGDPFILAPRRIADVTRALANIPHVQSIRWHTRVPVVAPERVSTELIKALLPPAGEKPVWIAVHTNHASELTPPARAALSALSAAGIPLVSQTVLLKGINDSVDALEALFRKLVANRVKPYYLHHGDLAPGTAHLRTSIEEGQRLMVALRSRLTGLAMPTYVLDIPGGHGKVPVDAAHVGSADPETGERRIVDANGRTHIYRDRA